MPDDDPGYDTYTDTDPRHYGRQLPRPSPLVRGPTSLQALGLDNGAGAGGIGGQGGLLSGIGGMIESFLHAIMQMFHISSTNLDNHNQQRSQADANSNAGQADTRVRQMAASDPKAKALLDGYNTTANGVQAAIADAKKTPSAAAFLALQSAEMSRSMASADIVKYDAGQRGDDHMGAHAIRWKESAQGVQDALAEIQQLPPAQQQQAMDKFARDNPNSTLAGDWKKFESGDLSKWTSESNDALTANAPLGRSVSAASQYDLPGEALNGADKVGLQAAFTAAANGALPAAPATPAPQGPAVGQRPATPSGPGT